jgi:hypothetical protein
MRRLSWHLQSVLEAISLWQPVEGSHRHQLAMNYATQLEQAGLWEWSIYVVLSLPLGGDSNDEARESAVRHFLARHVDDLLRDNTKQQFLVETLRIPIAWIDEAKSWFSRQKQDVASDVKFLLSSQQWDAAHHLLMNKWAPSLLLKLGRKEWPAELEHALRLLEQHRGRIKDWETGGSLFVSYFTLLTDVNQLLEDFISEDSSRNHRIAQLLQRCNDFAARLGEWMDDIRNKYVLFSLIHSHPVDDSSFLFLISFSCCSSRPFDGPYRHRDWDSSVILEQVVCAEMSSTVAHLIQRLLELRKQVAKMDDAAAMHRVQSDLVPLVPIASLGLPEDYRISHINAMAKQWLATRAHM